MKIVCVECLRYTLAPSNRSLGIFIRAIASLPDGTLVEGPVIDPQSLVRLHTNGILWEGVYYPVERWETYMGNLGVTAVTWSAGNALCYVHVLPASKGRL